MYISIMRNRKNGFSLVEMSIVLIIFGMVMAAASSILTLFVNKGGAERTRKMIEADKNALFSIAASDGFYGTESTVLTQLTYPQDAYGVDMTLIIDKSLQIDAGLSTLTYSPICGTNITDLQVRLCPDADCDGTPAYTTVTDVAFVLASGSTNKTVQTAKSSDVSGDYDYVNVYPQGTNGIAGKQYDDIVDWVTLPELRAKAGCDPERLRLTNVAMPILQEGATYEYRVFIEGGIPFVSTDDNTQPNYLIDINDPDGLQTEVSAFWFGGETDNDVTDFLYEITVSPVYGEQFLITTNGVLVTNGALSSNNYRLELTVSDNSSAITGHGGDNTITKTLYIQVP